MDPTRFLHIDNDKLRDFLTDPDPPESHIQRQQAQQAANSLIPVWVRVVGPGVNHIGAIGVVARLHPTVNTAVGVDFGGRLPAPPDHLSHLDHHLKSRRGSYYYINKLEILDGPE